jgi:hypothetical protein
MLENIIRKINTNPDSIRLDNEESIALILEFINDSFSYKKAESANFFHYIDINQQEKIGVYIKFKTKDERNT